ISIFATDMLIRIIHDLQKSDVDRRLASVLRRMAWTDDTPITISQYSLGIMANASRKQTNAALQRFTEAGWILRGYRSITVLNKKSLENFSE
ncbi:helix-turn-helix domain-containing protein, partial [Cutibacterium acnes subsp. acnes]|nr:helix-turn-helix domain-containing protein [Cutibacterium acnes subsp. acnes]